MSSKKVLNEISELMDVLEEVGKDCLIKEGHLTLSVRHHRYDPMSDKEELQKVVDAIIQHIPSTFEMRPGVDWVDIVHVIADTRHGRIEVELELPLVIFPSS
ncbi:hypothetical protein ACFLV5_02470 [Chloroflexota bacterium]